MIVELPWYPRLLSPNKSKNLNSFHRAKLVRDYRALCHGICLEQNAKFDREGKIPTVITFYPPDRKKRDLDGMLSGMKNGIDGVCEYLGIDDYRLRPIVLDVGDPVKGGKVVIEFQESISEF